jgi:hypothetical protein
LIELELDFVNSDEFLNIYITDEFLNNILNPTKEHLKLFYLYLCQLRNVGLTSTLITTQHPIKILKGYIPLEWFFGYKKVINNFKKYDLPLYWSLPDWATTLSDQIVNMTIDDMVIEINLTSTLIRIHESYEIPKAVIIKNNKENHYIYNFNKESHKFTTVNKKAQIVHELYNDYINSYILSLDIKEFKIYDENINEYIKNFATANVLNDIVFQIIKEKFYDFPFTRSSGFLGRTYYVSFNKIKVNVQKNKYQGSTFDVKVTLETEEFHCYSVYLKNNKQNLIIKKTKHIYEDNYFIYCLIHYKAIEEEGHYPFENNFDLQWFIKNVTNEGSWEIKQNRNSKGGAASGSWSEASWRS